MPNKMRCIGTWGARAVGVTSLAPTNLRSSCSSSSSLVAVAVALHRSDTRAVSARRTQGMSILLQPFWTTMSGIRQMSVAAAARRDFGEEGAGSMPPSASGSSGPKKNGQKRIITPNFQEVSSDLPGYLEHTIATIKPGMLVKVVDEDLSEGFWIQVTEQADGPGGGYYLGTVSNDLGCMLSGGEEPYYNFGDTVRFRAGHVWCVTPDFEPETVATDPYLRFFDTLGKEQERQQGGAVGKTKGRPEGRQGKPPGASRKQTGSRKRTPEK